MTDSIGVAVIGAGMAGRSHAHAYRTAQTVFGTEAPPVRLVAIADVNSDFANHTRDRYGFERTESSWQAIADADDVDAVSIVVANHLHRDYSASPNAPTSWRYEGPLGSGALADLGSHLLDLSEQLCGPIVKIDGAAPPILIKGWLGQAPSVVRAEATLKKPDIDAAMRVELAYPGSIPGRLHWDMNAEARQMVWTVTGTAATAVVPAFAVPHMDNRILITRDGSTEEQTLGNQTSYTYQLAAVADTLETGAEFVIDVDDSVANAEVIDEVYRRAGLSPRG